jgi:RNA polymerase sigma factor (TIGR02999 family)
MLTTPAMARAFAVSKEDPRLRDRYGRHLWGQSCPLARRLTEAGRAAAAGGGTAGSVLSRSPGGPTRGMLGGMADVTQLLAAAQAGDPAAAAELLPLVYDELRKLAGARLAGENPGQTLQATALVHEAYLRLVGGPAGDPGWAGRGHFFAAAAEAMRRILVDTARRKKRARHGGGRRRVGPADHPLPEPDDELLALDEAMTELAAEDAVAAKVVELRHFAGLGHEDVAVALGVTVYQARQKWTYARAWLRKALAPRE